MPRVQRLPSSPAIGFPMPKSRRTSPCACCSARSPPTVTSFRWSEVVRTELPVGVEHLPAGPKAVELAAEAARRTGGEVMTPSVAGIGETFGAALLDTTADAAIAAARDWRADVVLSEVYCTVGAVVAATLNVPWHRVTMTAGLPVEWTHAIERAAAARHDERGIRPAAPESVLDLWPPLLRDPEQDGPEPGVPVLRVAEVLAAADMRNQAENVSASIRGITGPDKAARGGTRTVR